MAGVEKNQIIIEEFLKLENQIKRRIDLLGSDPKNTKEYFRLKSITNAVEVIKKYPKIISSGDDLKGLKGIGSGIIKRIDEILETGKLKEIEHYHENGDLGKSIENLMEIHGIGRKSAYKLVTKHNIRSIDDLKKAQEKKNIRLNSTVMTALKFYNMHKQSIPRPEMDEYNDYLTKKARQVDQDFKITLCGSYRRLMDTSNDVDVLVVHPKIKNKTDLLRDTNYLLLFIKLLKKDKFLVGDLTSKKFEMKYMGYCESFSDPHSTVRRIDIRFVPFDSYYTALLYFTGSGDFNRRMRRLADQQGYLLNEYGLYKMIGDKKKRIKIASEEEVFEELKMEYLPPEKRK